MAVYLTLNEAAGRLGLNQKQVQELCQKGVLQGAFQDPSGSWVIPEKALKAWGKAQPEVSTSISYSVSDVRGSTVVQGEGNVVTAQQGLGGEDLAKTFQALQQYIQGRPPQPDVDSAELSETVHKIEEEAAKGEAANPTKLERWMKYIADLAPDVIQVLVTSLANPASGIGQTLQNLATRVLGG